MASTRTEEQEQKYRELIRTEKDLETYVIRSLFYEEMKILLMRCVGKKCYKGMSFEKLEKEALASLRCCACGKFIKETSAQIFGAQVEDCVRAFCKRECYMQALSAKTLKEKELLKCICFHVTYDDHDKIATM